ncbi:hypothetical protein WMY93_032334 [Mugilogobius chulae]|uniref:Uncharacterized protein n=1 Tax=Mugilogobius chulae TaxID=88201 RepID=A0AAW0MP27_9GOBI
MAAEVHAELRLRDGQKRSVRVQTGTGTVALGSLISAVRELSHSVTCLLTELVQQEQSACAAGEELSEDEDDDEDASDSEPQSKQTKP